MNIASKTSGEVEERRMRNLGKLWKNKVTKWSEKIERVRGKRDKTEKI